MSRRRLFGIGDGGKEGKIMPFYKLVYPNVPSRIDISTNIIFCVAPVFGDEIDERMIRNLVWCDIDSTSI